MYKTLKLGERPHFTCALITNLKAEAVRELRKLEEMSTALAYIYHFYLHGPDVRARSNAARTRDPSDAHCTGPPYMPFAPSRYAPCAGLQGTRSKYLHRGSVSDPVLLTLEHLISAQRIRPGENALRFSMAKKPPVTYRATLLENGRIQYNDPARGLQTYQTPEEWVSQLPGTTDETIRVGLGGL